MAKRLFDVLAASVALVVLAPLMIAAAGAILIADGRPVLYLATRSRRGRAAVSTVEVPHHAQTTGQGGAVVTACHDPRVFAVGPGVAQNEVGRAAAVGEYSSRRHVDRRTPPGRPEDCGRVLSRRNNAGH